MINGESENTTKHREGLTGNFHELFDDANSFQDVRFAADFGSDPKHLVIHQLNNRMQLESTQQSAYLRRATVKSAQCRYRRAAGAGELYQYSRRRAQRSKLHAKSSSRTVVALKTDWYPECAPDHVQSLISSSLGYNPPNP